jgi:hypothetical protein
MAAYSPVTERIMVYTDGLTGGQILLDGQLLEGRDWSMETLARHCKALVEWIASEPSD